MVIYIAIIPLIVKVFLHHYELVVMQITFFNLSHLVSYLLDLAPLILYYVLKLKVHIDTLS